ncbi:MAG: ATPase domain-containing protein [bacterium]|nr:ATPase domain-containing protein [bacterium]
MSVKLQTNVSKSFWCTPKGNFEAAEIPSMKKKEDDPLTISWFDKLFEGGILLPGVKEKGDGTLEDQFKGKPLTFLITGPPGGGKTTLALELCYRLAEKENEKGLTTLYISTDAEAEKIIENAKSFKWKGVETRIRKLSKELIKDYKVHGEGNQSGGPPHSVIVWGTDKIGRETILSKVVKTALYAADKYLTGPVRIPYELVRIFRKFFTRLPRYCFTDILVIDSLNIVEPTERSEFFKQFLKTASRQGPKMILFVLDSRSSSKEHEFWEYVCDIVVRLDYEYKEPSKYMVRTMEIIKARYQSHAWGTHQLKPYPPCDIEEKNSKERRRSHPYRDEGGIFIFPSIHYFLSLYKRVFPKPPVPVPTLIETLNEILKEEKKKGEGEEKVGGFPGGRCTAFIGCRGGHKSHLGYLHLLSRITEKGEKGLVVSLRDDEELAKRTMDKILSQQLKTDKKLDDLETQDQLEILYYPPGYITPEEFYHRMFMSIHRLKKRGEELTVLFNSLDQLAARFPLCAKEDIFIPGIIDTFSAEGITSIFIAVEEPGQPPEQYGLLTMADLILSFSQRQFTAEEYHGHLKYRQKTDKEITDVERELGNNPQAVVLRVVRFAGGQAAGAGGILELVEKDKSLHKIYKEEGLHFTPFSPESSQGESIEGQSRKTGKV